MYNDIVLENPHFKLIIGEDCICKSLIHKASRQECLMPGKAIPLCSVTQPRFFNNEIKLANPIKRTTLQANRIRRDGNQLVIGFEVIPYEAILEVKEMPEYISFRLTDFIVHPADYPDLCMATPPVETFRILQLPIKRRSNFGHWLNVTWDQDVAVNVLATSPYAAIDSEKHGSYLIMTADALRETKLKGVEAALIVSQTSQFLDAVDTLEKDYFLPLGVQNRRRKEVRISTYFAQNVNPNNVDKHIQYCKQCGYGMMTVYFASLFKGDNYSGCGDCNYRDTYPEGLESLRKMLQKIKSAGIIPGIHFLHTHIGLKSSYISPVADHRLHLTSHFTLAKPLGVEDTTVYVEQNPENTVLVDGCRILQFDGELIYYTGYSDQPPYCFTGCQRGHLDTNIVAHPLGQIGGILDVSEYCATSCYLDQNSSLQDEIADKLAELYRTGFEYIYFDGAEGTNEPSAFHVSNGMYRTYQKMFPAPIMCEGAAKSHFSWHFLTGGNAFDIFPIPVFKEMMRRHPAEEAPRMQQDFTRLNFGWWCFDADLQPDHWEYGSSLAAAWDCPATIQASIKKMSKHPRLDDLLEILRRWEDVRVNSLLTEEQKAQIHRDPMQEHILLLNEEKKYEIVPYHQIQTTDAHLRAFFFQRNGQNWVVYWHTCGECHLELPFDSFTVQDELYEPPIVLTKSNRIPASHRRYLQTTLSKETLVNAFSNAQVMDEILPTF